MRRKLLVALGSIAVALVAVVVVACSNSNSCKPNTLALQVIFSGTSDLADTVTVTGSEPGAMTSQSFPHTPGDASAFNVDVSWPGGYPANKLVNLLIKATGGVTVLGANIATVHLDPTCTSAHVILFGNSIPDAAPTD